MSLTQVLLILFIICILFLLYGYLSNYKLTITHHHIKSEKLYSITKGKPLVILSDLHNCRFGKANKKIKEQIDAISPSYICIAGDMVNNSSENNNYYAKDFINYLKERYTIFYADGNHEQGFFEDDMGEFSENKYNLFFSNLHSKQICDKVHKGNSFYHLTNSYVEINKVRIYGLRIDREYYGRFKRPDMSKDYIQELLGSCDKDYYNILIAHNPLYFDYYSGWGANLVISGHVHGGIMRLPFLGGVISPQMILFPKYSGGKYINNNSTMILSRGLGTHTIRFRFFNPPEVVVLHVCK